ncbi:MAG: GIY-YIG nuclease family protein [Bacteroidales bacterium]
MPTPATKFKSAKTDFFYIWKNLFNIHCTHKHKKSYVGITNNLIQRFLAHNKFKHGWTAKYRPWVIVHFEVFDYKKRVPN